MSTVQMEAKKSKLIEIALFLENILLLEYLVSFISIDGNCYSVCVLSMITYVKGIENIQPVELLEV